MILRLKSIYFYTASLYGMMLIKRFKVKGFILWGSFANHGILEHYNIDMAETVSPL